MESISVMESFSQQPMLMEPRPLRNYASSPHKAFPRDASFSSYLTPDLDDSELSIFEAQKYFNEGNDHKRPSPSPVPVSLGQLGQIAEHCDLASAPRFSSVSSLDDYGRHYRARSFHATPTASSEASWNSQTGLLCKPPGSMPVSLRALPLLGDDKKRGSSAKWFFRRKCPCSGEKSIQVEEKLSEPKTPARSNHTSTPSPSYPPRRIPLSLENFREKSPGKSERSPITRESWTVRQEIVPNSNRFKLLDLSHRVMASGRPFSDAGFSFPVLNASTPTTTTEMVLQAIPPTAVSDDPPRYSLEVFRPRDSHRDRHSFTFRPSPKSRMPDDDIASDASSDLFEIESFSTQPTMYPRRDSLDEASNFNARRGALYCPHSLEEPATPSIAPTECYEPSEASIDWSVTTAEGFAFDRGSVTTVFEVDDARREWEKNGGGGGGGSKRRGNGGLLSCRCEKAVSVGPQPVKYVGRGIRRGPQWE